jgi:hypothetical protein
MKKRLESESSGGRDGFFHRQQIMGSHNTPTNDRPLAKAENSRRLG